MKNWDENKVYDEAVKEEIEKRFSLRINIWKIFRLKSVFRTEKGWHDESELEENISVSAKISGRTGSAGSRIYGKQEEYKGAAKRYCLPQSNGMSELCRSRYRGTASGSVKETSGEPENDRAGSRMYPDLRFQEVYWNPDCCRG